MEGGGSRGGAASNEPYTGSFAAPDYYKHGRRSSYRRAMEASQQDTLEQQESPVIPQYAPAPTTIPRKPVASSGRNDSSASGSASHRRRESQPYPIANSGPPPSNLATANPSRAPPVLYNDQYGAPPTRSHDSSKHRSSGSQAQPPDIYIPPRPYEPSANLASPLPSVAPGVKDKLRSGSLSGSGMQRRESVPDRSPLQTLEGKLDDISKEERRARVQEAEFQAQERAAAGRGTRQSRDANTGSAPIRVVSGPETSQPLLPRTQSGRRHVSAPVEGLVDAGHPEKGVIDFGPPWNPEAQQSLPRLTRYYSAGGGAEAASAGAPAPAQAQPAEPLKPQRTRSSRQSDGSGERNVLRKRRDSNGGVQRGASFKERSVAARNDTQDRPREDRPSGRSAAIAGGSGAAAGLGLSGMSEQRHPGQHSDTPGTRPDVGIEKPTRASTDPHHDYQKSTGVRDVDDKPTAQKQLGTERMGKKRALKAAKEHLAPDPVPPEAVLNPHPTAPKYDIPPQTHGGQVARDRVGFGSVDPEQMASPPHEMHHHHLGHVFHRDHDPERRYLAPKPLTEWRQAEVASLRTNDLNVDGPDTTGAPGAGSDTDQPWWERGGSQRRRSGGAVPQAVTTGTSSYDGGYDQPAGQTSFNPPLYLKCGPLLRYTGIRREGTKEIWRGSAMMVTIDKHSIYDTPPTLRLFVQPMDLLPPPPAQLDASSGQQLAPEYVDPLAGHVKMSRTGKTLYVRPVEDLEVEKDLSRIEDDTGLFEESPSPPYTNGRSHNAHQSRTQADIARSRFRKRDGEKAKKFREVRAHRLHAERGVTFWRFNLEVELGAQQTRIAYRINSGPAVGFWVPARGQTMHIMFHSCNGFSISVNPNIFSGPDPMWRDVLNTHQIRPFHVMIGGGDQIYNDAAMRQTRLFQDWLATKNPIHKHSAQFTVEMQDELEDFYLNRYAMWFSQGLFGMANSQIPMINMWDDHDIIDGFGSYPHHFMSTAVFTGVGAVAFKYYMLFQQQSVVDESSREEPSWLLGASPGPYINELSRSIFLSLGKHVAFLALDCRTERMRDEILSEETYELVFERCRREIIKGETRHLIVLLGVPIAYPRLNFVENVLTSRLMDPIKAIGRAGLLGGFVNKFDGGVEILDDLDDHWTAKHHKRERNEFIRDLQDLAAEKSIRVTILGGDVHLAACGQFYSNKKLGIPKDRDHRYMPNVICSAIVNTPPPELMADVLNKRNKVHHLDRDTDEDMIPLFTHDVDGKPRNNHHLLPRRNWCSIREYQPGSTPPPSRPASPQRYAESPYDPTRPAPGKLSRTNSLTRADFRPGNLMRRLSRSERGPPPPAYYNNAPELDPYSPQQRQRPPQRRSSSAGAMPPRPDDTANSYFPPPQEPPRPNPFHRKPTGLSEKAAGRGGAWDRAVDAGGDGRGGHIDLSGGLDIVLNVEVSQKDPAGITTPYRLLVPALGYVEPVRHNQEGERRKSVLGGLLGLGGRKRDALSRHHNRSFESYHSSDVDDDNDSHRNSTGNPPPVHSAGFGADSQRDARTEPRDFGAAAARRDPPPQPQPQPQMQMQPQPQQPPLQTEKPLPARPGTGGVGGLLRRLSRDYGRSRDQVPQRQASYSQSYRTTPPQPQTQVQVQVQGPPPPPPAIAGGVFVDRATPPRGTPPRQMPPQPQQLPMARGEQMPQRTRYRGSQYGQEDEYGDEGSEGSITPPGGYGGRTEGAGERYGYEDPRGYDGGYEDRPLRKKAGWKIWK
ncbi:hypothetical protein H2201_000942 [Coniosporium apollinis]|uniref:PhoD-like phosphatase domain-containing protein n=1 Tax=Coniosporium apollinis TaxID=61459 RepID=A0ABQ9P556_9PEZI|nr:hypothetical protein H2201_000942 [Coniosporium apollinis]